MKTQEIIDALTAHNQWRRYDRAFCQGDAPEMTCPIEMGLVIDAAIEKLKTSSDNITIPFKMFKDMMENSREMQDDERDMFSFDYREQYAQCEELLEQHEREVE